MITAGSGSRVYGEMHAGTQLTMSNITEQTHGKENQIFGPQASTPCEFQRSSERVICAKSAEN